MLDSRFTYEDSIVLGELIEISRKSPIPCDKEGDAAPPIMRRSVFLDDKLVESFDFDSLKDPKGLEHKKFWAKYGN